MTWLMWLFNYIKKDKWEHLDSKDVIIMLVIVASRTLTQWHVSSPDFRSMVFVQDSK